MPRWQGVWWSSSSGVPGSVFVAYDGQVPLDREAHQQGAELPGVVVGERGEPELALLPLHRGDLGRSEA